MATPSEQLSSLLALKYGPVPYLVTDRVWWCRQVGVLLPDEVFAQSRFCRWSAQRANHQQGTDDVPVWFLILEQFTLADVAEYLEQT